MIESAAEKLAVKIKQANIEETVSVPVMKFALIFVINFIIPILLACLIGAVTGKLSETLLTIAAFVPLRMLSGGYHFNSPVACILVSTTALALPPHIAMTNEAVFFLTAVSLALVLWRAPANMKGYNTMPERYYPILKAVCVLIVAGNFLIASPSFTLVFVMQGVSLLFLNKEVNRT